MLSIVHSKLNKCALLKTTCVLLSLCGTRCSLKSRLVELKSQIKSMKKGRARQSKSKQDGVAKCFLSMVKLHFYLTREKNKKTFSPALV